MRRHGLETTERLSALLPRWPCDDPSGLRGGLALAVESDYAPMRNVAELLVPAIRWDTTTGFARERDRIARALELGVGGFVLHGGPEAEVRALIKDLRQASKIPLLIGAELERGVGPAVPGNDRASTARSDCRAQRPEPRSARRQADGARGAAAWCQLGFRADVRSAHESRERSHGAGRDLRSADEIGAIASLWIEACQHEGMLACAKHFPGAGRVGETNGSVRPAGGCAAEPSVRATSSSRSARPSARASRRCSSRT